MLLIQLRNHSVKKKILRLLVKSFNHEEGTGLFLSLTEFLQWFRCLKRKLVMLLLLWYLLRTIIGYGYLFAMNFDIVRMKNGAIL